MIKAYKIQRIKGCLNIFAVAAICVLLQACASQPKDPVQTKPLSVEGAPVQAKPEQPQTLKAQDVRTAEDALFDMKQRLDSINHSPANQVSALSYMKGNFGRNIDIFPLNEPIENAPVLKPRGQSYPRHTLQAGQNIFTPEQNPSVIVFPYDPNARPTPVTMGQDNAQQMQGRFLTRAETRMTTAPKASAAPPRSDRRPNQTARRLTGYE